MTRQTLDNLEAFSSFRADLNSNFTELYNRVVHVSDLGAVTAANINAAIAQVAAAGGGDVILPSGEYNINATIDVAVANVRLKGAGGDTSHGAGTNFTQKTVLKWTGTAGGTMMKFRTPYGATAQRLYGMGLSQVELSGEDTAAIGLEIDSVSACQFQNIHVKHCTSIQYNLICGETGVDGPAGEALDLQFCDFNRMSFDTRNTGFTATTAIGWVMDGSANANVSGNRFELLNGIYGSGTGYHLIRADNNVFMRCSASRVAGTGTIYTWLLEGSDSTTNEGAYANTFIQVGWDATNGMNYTASLGTDSANVRVNMVIGYDQANGGGPPVVGGNSRITYFAKDGTISDATKLLLRQQGSTKDDGFITWESLNRHNDWVSGTSFFHGGEGFTRTDVFQNISVVSALGRYEVDNVDVVGPRRTGWTAATGSATRTTFDTTTATTQQLAERVKALLDDLIAHGLIGT